MKLLLRKALGTLEPVDDMGRDALQKIAFGRALFMRLPMTFFYGPLFGA